MNEDYVHGFQFSAPTVAMNDESFQFSQSIDSEIPCNAEPDERKRTRNKNDSMEEDIALVRSWLNISEDPEVGRDQKSTRLWERILDNFHQFLGKITERNDQGLQNRWGTISHDVSKFCGHYNKVGRLNPSGWNDQKKFDEAKEQFRTTEGPLQPRPVEFYKFKFEHCWNILKDTAKWNNFVVVRNTSNPSKRTSNPKSQTINLENLGDTPLDSSTNSHNGDNSPNGGQNLVRPEGRQKVKLKRKRESKEEKSVLYLRSINETLKEATMIEKEKWEANKKKEYQRALNQEMKVMSQSMVGLTPEQQTYWKLQQSIILDRYKATGLLLNNETSNACGTNIDLNDEFSGF